MVENELAGPEADDVIDLRFGVPGDCPECREHATLAYVDIRDRVSRHECAACNREWWVADAHPGVEFSHHP